MIGFIECHSCKKKPGLHYLCKGCLSNRSTIQITDQQTDMRVKRIGRMADVIRGLKADIERLQHEPA